MRIQEVFELFEKQSFKYQQALREINYELFTSFKNASPDLSEDIAQLILNIDDVFSTFDRFRVSQISDLTVSGVLRNQPLQSMISKY